MGWYSALSCAGTLTAEDGFTVFDTVGSLMQERLIGDRPYIRSLVRTGGQT